MVGSTISGRDGFVLVRELAREASAVQFTPAAGAEITGVASRATAARRATALRQAFVTTSGTTQTSVRSSKVAVEVAVATASFERKLPASGPAA